MQGPYPFIEPGPGSELTKLIAELEIVVPPCSDCKDLAARMDKWGVDGCREHRAEVVEHLAIGRKQTPWRVQLAAALKATKAGLWVNPLNPGGSLVDEAIRRAKAKEVRHGE